MVTVPSAQEAEAVQLVAAAEDQLRLEFGHLESGLSVRAVPAAQPPSAVLAEADAARLLTLLLTLPHGPIKYSHAVGGLVETSSNLAAVCAQGEGGLAPGGEVTYRLHCSTRSSLMPALERCRGSIRRIAGLCGAEVEQDEAYPGWAPQPAAEIVQLAGACIGRVVGRAPEVKAIHAGLECGIIGEKIPGVQSVSYGPTITGAHSPDERVQVSTVQPFWEATVAILGELADKRA